jgi:hypothetical protein
LSYPASPISTLNIANEREQGSSSRHLAQSHEAQKEPAKGGKDGRGINLSFPSVGPLVL